MSFSGGCQCGAVRYRAAKAPEGPHLCHCRMCQKAAGNYFMPLGGVMHADFEITRRAVSYVADVGNENGGRGSPWPASVCALMAAFVGLAVGAVENRVG